MTTSLKTIRIISLVIFLLLTTAVISACVGQIRAEYEPLPTHQSELYFYLQPLPQEMQPLSFTISAISLISEQNSEVPLLRNGLVIDGSKLIGIQKKLFTKVLSPGRFKGILLTISKATIATEEGPIDLLPPDDPLQVDLQFSMGRNQALALFLGISPEYLVADGFRFTPRFVLSKPHQHPKNFLGFVSSSQKNIITVFNKKTMEVIQIIRTGLFPKGMALDQENGIVYVALAGDDAIELINVESMETYGRVRLRFGDEPAEVALSPDGNTLVSVNYGSGTVSLIDTRTLSETRRLTLDPDPAWVVTGPATPKAYVLHSLSNTVSIIDLPGRRLQTVVTLDTPPLRGALSGDGNSLYIISEDSTNLRLMDTFSRSVAGTVFIGGNSSSILVDSLNDLLYIGKETDEIVVVNQSSGMFIDSFAIKGDAFFMAIDGEENMLLVLSADQSKIHKFNLVSKKLQAVLTTENGAHGLVVMGEL